ncbi:hypothetical protein P9112_007815 [Eukaryota sp. TZLM1-RC]
MSPWKYSPPIILSVFYILMTAIVLQFHTAEEPPEFESVIRLAACRDGELSRLRSINPRNVSLGETWFVMLNTVRLPGTFQSNVRFFLNLFPQGSIVITNTTVEYRNGYSRTNTVEYVLDHIWAGENVIPIEEIPPSTDKYRLMCLNSTDTKAIVSYAVCGDNDHCSLFYHEIESTLAPLFDGNLYIDADRFIKTPLHNPDRVSSLLNFTILFTFLVIIFGICQIIGSSDFESDFQDIFGCSHQKFGNISQVITTVFMILYLPTGYSIYWTIIRNSILEN